MNAKRRIHAAIELLLASLLLSMTAAGQQPAPETDRAKTAELEKRLDQLMTAVDGVSRQIADSQREIEALTEEMRQVKMQLAASGGSGSDAAELKEAVRRLEEQSGIQQAEIKQHDQTKVESDSKYPVKISGLLLFSSFLNHGAVDDIDLPLVALPRKTGTDPGDLAATMRQTILGLRATGPRLWGARSSADISVDFYGGLPYAAYTTSSGTLRLRTAHTSLDWGHTSATVAFDSPLISPLQPTSLVSQATPPLAWSGNLWIWSPQLSVSHRHALPRGTLGFELGLIDPASPRLPANQATRPPGAGENSRQPAYEARIGYSFGREDRAFSIGTGGFYSRQKYSNGQHADAWAGTADWDLPLGSRVEVSGEFYRGRALGGLGGGVFKDYYFNAVSHRIEGLNAIGGWTQLKLRLLRQLEANLAAGIDDGFADELRYGTFPTNPETYSNLARNRTVLGNVIFRPRAYLAFSAEYRDLHSWPLTGPVNKAQSLGLAAGYSF